MTIARGWSRRLRAVADRLERPRSRRPVPETAPESPQPLRQQRHVRALLRDLRATRLSVRASAVRELMERDAIEATENLMRLCSSSRREVRVAALTALLSVNPERFAEAASGRRHHFSDAELLADLDGVVQTLGVVTDGTR